MAQRVYLHIGAPKTGSTYVQNVLWKNHGTLRRAGILLPGSVAAHDQAMTDLRAVPWRESGATWTWDKLAELTARWPGDVIISNEGLAGATAEQAARAVRSLQPAEVHVVVASRDLWRTFPSMWQQSIRARNVWSFEAFLRAVEQGRSETFWDSHTANRPLRRWGDLVPAGRRHLITVPPPGAPHDLLWQRFAGVFGIPGGLCDLDGAATSNTSLGAAEIELLRRVNQALGERYPHRAPYQKVVQRHLVNAVLKNSANDTHFGVGLDRAGWVLDLAEEQIKELRDYPCQIVGDLDELRPTGMKETTTPDSLDDSRLLRTAIETIIGMLGNAEELSERVEQSYDERFARFRSRTGRRVRHGLRRVTLRDR